ncbi:MAG: LemA family protein, partial [Duncaniella sp.]|nr:LemA family protein [Duncaniella sp.]
MKTFKLLLLIVCMLPMLSSCNYNSLVEKKQGVEQSWAEVQNQYQRRADLIPNLVATVKGYATHESETLEKVTQARAAATSV